MYFFIHNLQMLKKLLKHKFTVLVLLFCLIFSSIILVSHSASHIFGQKISLSYGDINGDAPAKNHDAAHCNLCFTSNIFANFAFMVMAAFFVAEIYLFLVWRQFNIAKLSYLTASNSSRAPPFIS